MVFQQLHKALAHHSRRAQDADAKFLIHWSANLSLETSMLNVRVE
jgi:hypothetical protein